MEQQSKQEISVNRKFAMSPSSNASSIENMILSLPEGRNRNLSCDKALLERSMNWTDIVDETVKKEDKSKASTRLSGMRQRIRCLRKSNSNISTSSLPSLVSSSSVTGDSPGDSSDSSLEHLYKTKFHNSDSALSL